MSHPPHDFALICVAAGAGTRLGVDLPKAFVLLDGQPMYRYALACFAHRVDLVEVVLVVPQGHSARDIESAWDLGQAHPHGHTVVGGRWRTDSVRAGLAALDTPARWVAIHDAARPLTEPGAIDAVLSAAYTHGAAMAATPVRDTLKQVADDSRIVGTVPRAGLWQAQTPQVFRRDWITQAYAQLGPEQGADVTDDAELVERLGHTVHVIDATIENIKITYPSDLAMAEMILARRRAQSAHRGSSPTPSRP